MDSNDAPTPPNYAAIAAQQAMDQLALNRSTTSANRPNQITPGGTLTWSQDPNNPDLWTSTTELSPLSKQIYDATQSSALDMANLSRQAAGGVTGILGQPLDLGQLGDLPDANASKQATMDAMLGRVTAQNKADVDAKRSELIAAGIPIGSKAYQGQMAALDSKLNDARQQAEIAANSEAERMQGMNMRARQQAISEALLKRQTPLNEFSAITGGAQVQMPSFPTASPQSVTAAPNQLAAAQAGQNDALQAYQQNQANNRAIQSGLFQLGSSYLSNYDDLPPWLKLGGG